MQCEGFKPGCANTAEYTIKGYTFCLPCFRDFAGYSPGEEHKLEEQDLNKLLLQLDAQTDLMQKHYEIKACEGEDALNDPDYEPQGQVWLALEKESERTWGCGWAVQEDESTEWVWVAIRPTPLEAAQALWKEVQGYFS